MSEHTILLWTMIGTCATAAATIGLVVGALKAWQTAKATLDQMKHDSRSQTRPYVFAQIVPSIGGNQAWDLILRNSGRSAAYDLRLTVSAWPEEDILTKALRTMFETPQTLPPNTSIRSYWSLGPSKHPRSSHPVGFDQPVDLTVTYKSDNREASEYRDTFRLDSTVLGMTPMGASGIELPNGATPHEKKMREIVRALNEMRRGN